MKPGYKFVCTSIGILFGLLVVTDKAASSAMAASSLQVLTFNTWGVPFAAQDKWRYGVAMDEIAELSPDVVLLQEVFTRRGKRRFADWDTYPYRVDGPRAFPRLINSGLRILSKYPIERYAKLVYSRCKRDDCLSRKGAVLAVIVLPGGERVTVVNTHLNARGGDDIRLAQLDQLRRFVDYFREPGAPLLMGGDFNFAPESAVYPALLTDFSVRDAWIDTHADGAPGYTSDAEGNPYMRSYSLRYGFPLVSERIDYLLGQGARPLDSRLVFNQGTLLSDHYGIMAQFALEGAVTGNALDPSLIADLEVAVEDAEGDAGLEEELQESVSAF